MGNGNEKLLWSRYFSINQYTLWDSIYDIEIYPIYHTTFYIHIISYLEKIFGFNIFVIKLFVLSIKILTIYLVKILYFQNKNDYFILAIILWISSPIVFFGENYFEVDGHFTYLIVFLFFHSLKLKSSIKLYLYQISLLAISFFIKETAWIILIISLTINLIFFREKIIEYILLLIFSILSIILIYILYCNITNLPIELLLKWNVYRFEFLLPGLVLDDSILNNVNHNYKLLISDKISSYLVATKGLFKFGYINLYLLIFYLIYKFKKQIIKSREFNFAVVMFLVTLLIVYLTGSYSPRYQVAFLLPIIVVLFTNLNISRNEKNYKSSNIINILIFLIINFFIGNYIENTKDIFNNPYEKFLILLIPSLILLLTIVYLSIRKELEISLIIGFIITINLSLNYNILKDGKSDYLNNPGTTITIKEILDINKRYKDYKIIVNTIDISPYLENFENVYYLKGYASILPGIDPKLLKIKKEIIDQYNNLNIDSCAGVYRCSYDNKKFKMFLNKFPKTIYIENIISNHNKNLNFIKEFGFKLLDKKGSFNIYEFKD